MGRSTGRIPEYTYYSSLVRSLLEKNIIWCQRARRRPGAFARRTFPASHGIFELRGEEKACIATAYGAHYRMRSTHESFGRCDQSLTGGNSRQNGRQVPKPVAREGCPSGGYFFSTQSSYFASRHENSGNLSVRPWSIVTRLLLVRTRTRKERPRLKYRSL